jgi:hypothetical protein
VARFSRATPWVVGVHAKRSHPRPAGTRPCYRYREKIVPAGQRHGGRGSDARRWHRAQFERRRREVPRAVSNAAAGYPIGDVPISGGHRPRVLG